MANFGRAPPHHQFIAFQSHSIRATKADADGARIGARGDSEVIFEPRGAGDLVTGAFLALMEQQIHSPVNGAVAKPREIRNPGAPTRGIGADEVVAAARQGGNRLGGEEMRALQAHANPQETGPAAVNCAICLTLRAEVQHPGGSLAPIGLEVDRQ